MSIDSQESGDNEFYHLMKFHNFVYMYRGDRKKFVLKHAQLYTCNAYIERWKQYYSIKHS